MSPQKIKSPPSSSPQPDLKSRVISCLNKLSDRDTLAVGTNELESIAQALTPDNFSPFLSCIHSTDDASKSPVRRLCVNILAFLSHSHGDDLSPVISKMMSIIVRRIRDADSTVRAACVAATAAIAAKVTVTPFSALLKPLVDVLTTEQDYHSQIGAAMCLGAMVEAAPEPETDQLRKLLPRAGKLLRSEGFKAKAAVLAMVGSVIGVGGVVNKSVLEWLVALMVEFLSSDDWAARKAAAESLGRLAAGEKDLAVEHKASCVKSLETRRFDKVKIVRETMTRTLALWKEVGDALEEEAPSAKSPPSGNGGASCFPSLSKSSHDTVGPLSSARAKKTVPTCKLSPRDTSSTGTIKKESTQKNNLKSPNSAVFSRPDRKKATNWKVEISLPHSASPNPASDNNNGGAPESGEKEGEGNIKQETRSALFSTTKNEKPRRFNVLKSGARVVPFPDCENFESGTLSREAAEEEYDHEKEMEDLSLVHRQLAQIENQQLSLFDLLQKFIGSSQNGMNSLESRVEGLEMALEEISYDLGFSNGRFATRDYADNTCCKLPGTDFLSSKFWRRGDGRYSTPRLSPSENFSSVAFSENGGPEFQIDSSSRNAESFSTRQRVRYVNGGEFIGTSSATFKARVGLSNRSSA